ncbi:hypothetical protein [Sphaerisporangium sp. TRM90804]|uniref:hypothetical protein n=1 Tax=Sphaerisporangium sp. TRM90804 TaxID=3031113 RepID=UPI00244B42B5|nr:hypothetical protein [Sphaerisporangium sp. TRM90804]MDH2429300.1 hypothetical protein [Sphaerisporangium sp. TRM90804]
MTSQGEQTDPYGMSPAARPSVGGYFPPSGPLPLPAQQPVVPFLAGLVAQQIHAIEQTYPAWFIVRLVDEHGIPAGWTATRHADLTAAQRATGLVPFLASDDAEGLIAALAVQDEIAHQARYSPGPKDAA